MPAALQGSLEPDDDPRVLADAAGVCNQMRNGRYGAFDQMATFTRRWHALSFLYARGDRQAACEIASLMRRVAEKPGSPCEPDQVDQFVIDCRPLP